MLLFGVVFSAQTLVGGILGIYVFLMIVSWVIVRKYSTQPRDIEAYNSFKHDFAADENQKILFIPGGPNLFTPTQTTIFGHCLRFLTQKKDKLAKKDLRLLVTDPFKYYYLEEHIANHQINARVDFVAIDQIGFVTAGLGLIDRFAPDVTFYTASLGFEVLILGEAASRYGSFYSAPDQVSTLPDAAVASKAVVIGEEVYALPFCENPQEKPLADRVFFLANDIAKGLIIILIIGETIYRSFF